jgi:hypothetical protein
MRNLISRYWLMTVGLLAAVVGGYAWAQGIIPLASPVGPELLTVYPLAPGGGLGGGQAQININQVRNSTGYQLVTGAATVTTVGTTSVDNLIGTGTFSGSPSWTVTMPASAFDGELFSIISTTGASVPTLTVNAAAGQTILGGNLAASTLISTAPASLEWQFSTATSTWYRVR